MREYQLGDDEVAILSINRQLRIAAEVLDVMVRNLPGVDPTAAKACANNLACVWGEYGIPEEKPPEVDYDEPMALMAAYLKELEEE